MENWLIDLHWVWDLTVPMNLGLTDRPFVPHNLISTPDSPVPLPKFPMAPRLKILMSSGSKKGTQICYPFLSKVPASKPPPGSPTGPLWRERPVSRAFLNISSRVPSKEALPRGPPHWASFIHLSKSPVDEPPSRFSCGAPMERDAHLQSLFYISSRVCNKGALPPGSFHRAPIERHPTSRATFSHLSKSPVDKPTPGCPTEPPWREMPIPELPSKGVLPWGPPHWVSLERERRPIPRAPFIHLSKSLVDEPPEGGGGWVGGKYQLLIFLFMVDWLGITNCVTFQQAYIWMWILFLKYTMSCWP